MKFWAQQKHLTCGTDDMAPRALCCCASRTFTPQNSLSKSLPIANESVHWLTVSCLLKSDALLWIIHFRVELNDLYGLLSVTVILWFCDWISHFSISSVTFGLGDTGSIPVSVRGHLQDLRSCAFTSDL